MSMHVVSRCAEILVTLVAVLVFAGLFVWCVLHAARKDGW